ncbi:MAG: hypothetical protein K8J08_12215 [Thermoanaerobaculia bacterium]|nr:hypothetical protein [Thermoanaerobaculia bacterium]
MATLKVKVGGPLAEANTRRQFPWRFHRFEGDALITALVQRYEDFRRNRDRLLSTAFFVLTALESVFGGRSALRSQLAVERRVINHFAEFVSEFGSLGTARKIRAKYKGQDLTSAQAYWLECTLRQLLLRAGQYRSGNLPTSSLSMSQLPPL